ncbi:MAG: response regulator [Candidatus Zipacnadales bacterium]
MRPANTATALIIEDNQDILRLLEVLLKRQGFRTECASGGAEGLEKARLLCPDIILLDLIMPGISGYEVLAELRADPTTSGIPIVVVTTEETMGRLEGEQLEYVLKPFSPEDLAAAVCRALGGVSHSRPHSLSA